MTFQPLLELTRAGLLESQHSGAIAVADAAGRLVAWAGDPHAVVFLRSSAKPFQAIPLVETGAAQAFGFTACEIALACASHSGSAQHVAMVQSMLMKAGVSEAHLGCGAHPVDDEDSTAQLIRAGERPTPVYHNCSGKHAGMLAVAQHCGWSAEEYLDPRHPLQQMILRQFAELCGLPVPEVCVGVDGCSAPNFAVPLVNAAMAFARLADPHTTAHADSLQVIFNAMTTCPEMVQAPGGFDTVLMEVGERHLVAKRGAEAYMGIGIVRDALGTGSPALGIAFKIADGASRATVPVAISVLRQLGALSPGAEQRLAAAGFPLPQPVKNWRGFVVGETRTTFSLER
ncbi:MAG: asparaginase [Anaerolineales bacterium]